MGTLYSVLLVFHVITAILLVVALALFTWRAYSSVTPFGWV